MGCQSSKAMPEPVTQGAPEHAGPISSCEPLPAQNAPEESDQAQPSETPEISASSEELDSSKETASPEQSAVLSEKQPQPQANQQKQEAWKREQARRKLLVKTHLLHKQQQKAAARASLAPLQPAGAFRTKPRGSPFQELSAVPEKAAQTAQAPDDKSGSGQLSVPADAQCSVPLVAAAESSSPHKHALRYDVVREVQLRLQADVRLALEQSGICLTPEARSVGIPASIPEELSRHSSMALSNDGSVATT